MEISYTPKAFKPETMEVIWNARGIVSAYQQQGLLLTLRQLYYRFVATGLFENTERNYKRLSAILSDARRAGLIDWDAIEDRTRSLRTLTSWTSPTEILQATVQSYHRDLWANQPCRVEVWIEKDALLGVIETVCQERDVPYFSCRGFVSDTEMWQAAYKRIYNDGEQRQRLVILHLGDHDPSGLDMTRDIESRLRLFSYNGNFELERIALNAEQIESLQPPPNPVKLTDSRAKDYIRKFGRDSWELDALNPTYIRHLVGEWIDSYTQPDEWNDAIQQQEDERKSLAKVLEKLNEGGDDA